MSSGIQALLKTEKDAAEIVNESRRYRTNRLKSAKADAQLEIEEYKKEKEKELQEYEQKHVGLNESIEKEADKQVEEELKSIRKVFEEKKGNVVKLVKDAVLTPKPEVHVNARK